MGDHRRGGNRGRGRNSGSGRGRYLDEGTRPMMGRGKALRGLADVVGPGDVIEQLSSPFTLAAGHPLRRMRCLLCAAMVGGRAVKSVVVVDYRGRGCVCGGVPSAAMLICAEHEIAADTDLATPAILRYYRHHPALRP